MPAGENAVISAGEGINGAMTSVIAPARTIRIRAGTKIAPKAGATMKHEATRMNGHSSCASHASSCPVVMEIMSVLRVRAELVDERRNALEELAGVADQDFEHPGSGNHERKRHRQQLGNEGQRLLVDLGCRLEGANDEPRDERNDQQRC